jgi:aldehyde dehydrogenase (NAD+)
MNLLAPLTPTVDAFLEQSPFGHYIGGAFTPVEGRSQIPVEDPAKGQPVAAIVDGTESDVDQAVRAAHAAFGAWRALSPQQRAQKLLKLADLMESHAEDLATIESLDVGKAYNAAEAFDVPFGIECVRYFAKVATGATYDMPLKLEGIEASQIRVPYGVCGFIFPWNFPYDLLMWGVVPALLAGNTVVVKPSEVTPLSTLLVARLSAEAGIPAGVLNVVCGRGPVGAALANHPLVRRMSFTGSPEVGMKVGETCGRRIVPCKLELGGKGAAVILEDADIDATAQALAGAITLNTGQVCCTATRWIIHDKVYDSFVDKVSAALAQVRIGAGLSRDSDMGPLVSKVQQERVQSYFDKGRQQGAAVVYDGSRNTVEAQGGYFVKPYLLAGTPDNVCFREEIFGPAAYLTRASDQASAIEQVNSLSYGLANSVWSEDLDRARTVAREMVAGNSWINAHNVFAYGLPYGGYGLSGTGGGVNSEDTFYDYLRSQTIARPL